LETSIYGIIVASIMLRSITVLIMSISIAVPLNFPQELGKKLGDWIAKESEKYFGLKTTLEDEEAISEISKLNKAAIFAFEPHDVLGYGCFAFSPVLKRLPPGFVPDNIKCLVSSAILNTPLVRNVSSWCRCGSVEKSSFRAHLKNGESIVFVPGGVQEVLLMDPSNPRQLILYLKNRKGFVKMALENGSPLVPVFCFGLDGSYAYHIPKGKIINQISRVMGFIPVLFWGRFHIPFGIPRPQKIHVVIGKPIVCPLLGEDVSSEDINKYHELFLNELEQLFERHKVGEKDYCDRELKIM